MNDLLEKILGSGVELQNEMLSHNYLWSSRLNGLVFNVYCYGDGLISDTGILPANPNIDRVVTDFD